MSHLPNPHSVESASDGDLLGAFADEGSEKALSTLIDRYSGLVIGTAERVTGCANLASEAAGLTFAILARKAGRLCHCDCLGRWLHRTATYEASKIARSERRHRRKLAVLAKSTPGSQLLTPPMVTTLDEPAWKEMVPHLDHAIEKLSSKDRQLIIDRFYHDHSLKEIARRLDVGEAAIQKRSQRAIGKLERILRKRGVTSATASVLVSGMNLQFSKPAMASLTNAILTQSAIQEASTLSLGTLLSHTFTTMSTMKSAATCGTLVLALACIPLGWQRLLIAKERRALEDLEIANVELRAQADMPAIKSQAAELRGVAGLLRRAHPSGGRAHAIDLLRISNDLDEMNAGNLIAAARTLRLKKGIMEMPAEEFRALLERVPSLELPHEKLHELVDFLAEGQKSQCPDAILAALSAILPKDRGYTHHSVVGSMRSTLTHLATQDPDAAIQWLKTVEREGLFEIPPTGPGGPYGGDPLPGLRGALFKGMLDHDETSALSLYHSFDSQEREEILQQSLLTDHEELVVRLAKELSNSNTQVSILGGAAMRKMSELDKGLSQDVFQFIDELDLNPSLQTKVAVEVANSHVQMSLLRDQGNGLPMEQGLEWLSKNLPKEHEMLAQGELIGHTARIDPKATERLKVLFEETGDDALIEGYLRTSFLGQRDTLAAFGWIARMQDSATRQQSIMGFAKQWDPRAHHRLKQLLNDANIASEDIDAVMTSIETPTP